MDRHASGDACLRQWSRAILAWCAIVEPAPGIGSVAVSIGSAGGTDD
jgi:hypothetical protein